MDTGTEDMRNDGAAAEDEESSTRPDAHGLEWTLEQHQALVALLVAGLPMEDIAAQLGRTPKAVTTRTSLLMPAEVEGVPLSQGVRVRLVRDQLRDPAYDWLTPLRHNLGKRIWSADDYAVLRQAWTEASPGIPELAVRLGTAEHLLAAKFVELGLGADVVEVTDRLGFTPGSPLEARRRRAIGATAMMVHVLVVLVLDEPVHVSVHPDADAAVEAARVVVPQLRSSTGDEPRAFVTADAFNSPDLLVARNVSRAARCPVDVPAQ